MRAAADVAEGGTQAAEVFLEAPGVNAVSGARAHLGGSARLGENADERGGEGEAHQEDGNDDDDQHEHRPILSGGR